MAWRCVTRIAGIADAAAAAGAGVVLAGQRLAAGRLRLAPDAEVGERFGELRGRALSMTAPDGVPLHVEVDGDDDAHDGQGGRKGQGGEHSGQRGRNGPEGLGGPGGGNGCGVA